MERAAPRAAAAASKEDLAVVEAPAPLERLLDHRVMQHLLDRAARMEGLYEHPSLHGLPRNPL